MTKRSRTEHQRATARHVLDRFRSVTFVKLRQPNGQWMQTFLNFGSSQLQVFQALGLLTAPLP